MHELVRAQLPAIEQLCREVGVRRLDLFGSAVGDSFSVESSDIDVLVEFAAGPDFDYFGSYFGLKEGLERIFDRPVDVVSRSALRNPYLLDQIEQTKEVLYMRRDPRTLLWEMLQSVLAIKEFLAGKKFHDYLADGMLRSAVERQFEIIGEALNQLSKFAPEIASTIPDKRQIVGFRNTLIHNYSAVDDNVVWDAAMDRLPPLERTLRELLDSQGN